MTVKIETFDARIVNKEQCDYRSTHVSIDLGVDMGDGDSAKFLLTVGRDGCTINRVWEEEE